MLFICGISILFSSFFESRAWLSKNSDRIFLLIGVIGFYILFMGISRIKINGYLKNSAYGIDYQKEFSTYIIIGKEKRTKNGALKFHKYSEWKEYVEKSFRNIIDDEDAYRFMIRWLRSKENYKELIISAEIPLEVCAVSIFYSAGKDGSATVTIISMFMTIIILGAITVADCLKCQEEIEFISDFNEIVFHKKSK